MRYAFIPHVIDYGNNINYRLLRLAIDYQLATTPNALTKKLKLKFGGQFAPKVIPRTDNSRKQRNFHSSKIWLPSPNFIMRCFFLGENFRVAGKSTIWSWETLWKMHITCRNCWNIKFCRKNCVFVRASSTFAGIEDNDCKCEKTRAEILNLFVPRSRHE